MLNLESIAAAGADLWRSHNNFWARIFRQSNKKKVFCSINVNLRWAIPFGDTAGSSEIRLYFFFFFLVSILLCSPSHKHLDYTNKRRLMSVPLVWRRVTEVGLPGPDCSQTPRLSSASLRLTPCQREVTEQTRRPPPSVLLLLHLLRQPAGPAGLGCWRPVGMKGQCRRPRHLLDFLSCLRHFRPDNLDCKCQC